MRKGYWMAAALALGFVGLGVTAFQKTLTPYVSFEEARHARRAVQVMGALDKQSDRYDTAKQELSFDLLDEKGGRIPVVFGPYHEGRIEAEKLLVKCPSKYQGAEVEKSYSSKPGPSGSRS